jgi:uncharacterized protein Yka (UPF0111/DUF47 family)
MSLKVIDSDAFLDMPLSTQAVYMHLLMRADDDGFVNNVKKIKRMICASDDDVRMLVAKGFVIPFDTGVVVIKHWRVHNIIRNDLYHPTIYQDEKADLIADKTGTYRIRNESVTNPLRDCIETESETYPNKINKVNKTKSNKESKEILLLDSSLSEPVRDKVMEFLEYREEIKKPYKSERSIKSLVTQVEKQEHEHGATAVIECINMTIGNQWQGIFWDKIGKPQGKAKGYDRKAQEDYARRMDALDEQNGDTEDSGFYM